MYTFPDGWLEIKCPTGDRTSQVSANTIRFGYGPDIARPRNVNGKWGLSVESIRKNRIKNSNSWQGAAWLTPGGTPMTITTMQPDPSGGMTATKFSSVGQQQSSYVSLPGAGLATGWFKGEGATSPYGYFAVEPGGINWVYATIDDSTNWKRYEAGSSDGFFVLETRKDADGDPPAIMYSSSIHAFAAQHETFSDNKVPKYPSSYIPTADVERIREADSLYTNFFGEIFQYGPYLNMVIKFAPNYASTEALIDHDILYMEGPNRLYFDASTQKFVLKTNNQTLTGPAAGTATWKREQELTLTIKTSPQGREFSLSGADTGNFSKLGDAMDTPSVTNTPIYILGNDKGAQECADLRYIGFFKPN
jgi:hypothetical protein